MTLQQKIEFAVQMALNAGYTKAEAWAMALQLMEVVS